MSAFSLTLSAIAALVGLSGLSHPGGAYWMDKELQICLAVVLAIVALVLALFSKRRLAIGIAAAVLVACVAPIVYGTWRDNRTWSVQVFNRSGAPMSLERVEGMPIGHIEARTLGAGDASEL